MIGGKKEPTGDEVQHIRDPIHGYIKVNGLERKILDTPELQRLRRVKQQKTTSLVYPGSTHTRFAHSVGTMYVAGQLAKSIGLPDDERQKVRLAGLLHDIGHGPFSHTSERVAQKYGKTHEERSCDLIKEMEHLLPYSSDEIIQYVMGNADVNIISGEIDADRMDYLNRDAQYSGIEHGNIDTDTIIRFAQVSNNQLVFERKAMEALKELLTARLHMDIATYNHHAARLSEVMIARALSRYVENNSVEEMMKKDDYEMHTSLMNAGGTITELYERVSNRNLYKRSFTIRGDEVEKSVVRKLANINGKEVEREIADLSGLETQNIIITKPHVPSTRTIDIPIKDNGEIKSFSDISSLPSMLETERWKNIRFDVYAPDGEQSNVKSSAESIIDSYL